mmetsp:Transcript_9639/g.23565  ORF Transcript_9639/g.23565 Transcript_9639/m.23565 type:complete len:177 (-) Transcript_9639:105-635(-)
MIIGGITTTSPILLDYHPLIVSVKRLQKVGVVGRGLPCSTTATAAKYLQWPCASLDGATSSSSRYSDRRPGDDRWLEDDNDDDGIITTSNNPGGRLEDCLTIEYDFGEQRYEEGELREWHVRKKEDFRRLSSDTQRTILMGGLRKKAHRHKRTLSMPSCRECKGGSIFVELHDGDI